MNIADITFAWFNTCKGGKAGENGGGGSVRIRASTQVIGSSGGREGRRSRMALCGN